jgi:hypothetical protein
VTDADRASTVVGTDTVDTPGGNQLDLNVDKEEESKAKETKAKEAKEEENKEVESKKKSKEDKNKKEETKEEEAKEGETEEGTCESESNGKIPKPAEAKKVSMCCTRIQ